MLSEKNMEMVGYVLLFFIVFLLFKERFSAFGEARFNEEAGYVMDSGPAAKRAPYTEKTCTHGWADPVARTCNCPNGRDDECGMVPGRDCHEGRCRWCWYENGNDYKCQSYLPH